MFTFISCAATDCSCFVFRGSLIYYVLLLCSIRSDLNTTLVKNIENEMEKGRSSTPPSITRERPNNALTEIWLLTKRDIIVQWRNPSYCFMRITSSIVMSLFLGILFFGDKSVLSGAVFSIGAIFFLVFVLVIPMQATVVPLVEDRAVRKLDDKASPVFLCLSC